MEEVEFYYSLSSPGRVAGRVPAGGRRRSERPFSAVHSQDVEIHDGSGMHGLARARAWRVREEAVRLFWL